jgi:hypothetical protein
LICGKYTNYSPHLCGDYFFFTAVILENHLFLTATIAKKSQGKILGEALRALRFIFFI